MGSAVSQHNQISLHKSCNEIRFGRASCSELRATSSRVFCVATMSRSDDETSVPVQERAVRKDSQHCITPIFSKADSLPTGRKAEEHFREFCDKTSLHGLQYLGEPRRHWAERVCWLLAILVSVVCCVLVIRKQWNKWSTSPVIVTFSDTSMPVWEIPFPAVTICPEVKFLQSDFNYTELINKENRTEQEQKMLDYSSAVCNLHEEMGEATMDEGIYNFLVDTSPHLNFVLKGCLWRGVEYEVCSDIFSEIITDEGLCYTFNMLVNKDLFNDNVEQAALTDSEHVTKYWSLETMYSTTEDLSDTYPRRTMTSGTKAGLSVFLAPQDFAIDKNCRVPINGFKIIFHSPAVFPLVSDQFVRLPSNRDVVIGVHPKVINTQEDLIDYLPQQRKCFFQKEKHLRFFRNYTQENCQIECVTNYTLDTCKCVHFYMPRSRDTPICGPGSADCTSRVVNKYNFDSEYHKECNCLPSCTEITYVVDISQAGHNWGKLNTELQNERFGTFTIFFRDLQILTMRRTELFGATDFLANCGGLLGLFLGFSVLSFVEVMYFLSLRIYGNNHSNRR